MKSVVEAVMKKDGSANFSFTTKTGSMEIGVVTEGWSESENPSLLEEDNRWTVKVEKLAECEPFEVRQCGVTV